MFLKDLREIHISRATIMMKKIVGRAYSSSANLGPGFDVVAISLDAFYDEVEASVVERRGVRVLNEVEGINPETNTAKLVTEYILEQVGREKGIELRVKKGVPIGKGLGSSGATAAAAAVAVNQLLGEPFDVEELVDFAARAEGAVAGTPHADNVAASLLGGFVVITSISPFRAVSIASPKKFKFIIAIPEINKIESKTKAARAILPESVTFSKLVRQSSSLAKLIAGFVLEDEEMVGQAMSSDEIVERAREPLVPGYAEVKRRALEAGALGVCISGAGPSVLILYKENPERIERAVLDVYSKLGIKAMLKRAKIGPGAIAFQR